jgi:hypothetical protein
MTNYRSIAALIVWLVAIAPPPAAAGPVFEEGFETACVEDNQRWKVSSQLRRQPDWPSRFGCPAARAHEGARALSVEVRPGDGREGAAGSNPSERAEIQVTAADLVQFDRPIWYRFAVRLDGPWRTGANRTVLHQIKQNIASGFDVGTTAGAPCVSANPFFRVHAREFDGRLGLRADVAESAGCPSEAGRHVVCSAVPIETDRWHVVHVALRASPDPDRGIVRVWIDGALCGTYRGRFGYPAFGVQRDGKPFVDTQPRFGIYRDAVPVAQAASFDAIGFWTAAPDGDPAWRGIAPLGFE